MAHALTRFVRRVLRRPPAEGWTLSDSGGEWRPPAYVAPRLDLADLGVNTKALADMNAHIRANAERLMAEPVMDEQTRTAHRFAMAGLPLSNAQRRILRHTHWFQPQRHRVECRPDRQLRRTRPRSRQIAARSRARARAPDRPQADPHLLARRRAA